MQRCCTQNPRPFDALESSKSNTTEENAAYISLRKVYLKLSSTATTWYTATRVYPQRRQAER